jgi:acyl-CoA hydrolase
MDKVAYACSAKHAGGYCVTASMNVVDFLAPVEVGDLVHLYAAVNHVGSSSVTVGIRVEAESILTGERRHTNSSYLTMVRVDAETKKAIPVPGLILETHEDMRRFLEAMKRKELVQEYKENFKNMTNDLDLDSMGELLKGQNCKLA